MVSPSDCPDSLALERLVQGAVSAEETETLAQHLEQCSTCAARVEALDRQSGPLLTLRPGAADPPPIDEQMKEVMERLARLSPVTAAPETPSRPAGTDPFFLATPVDLRALLAPPQAADEIGRLGSFRILKLLGQGGMGIVFEAEDPVLRRRVALKAMHPGRAVHPSARTRFLREAQAAAAVRHEHVATIYQAGEERGVAFLAMELLQGETLADRLRRGKLPLAEALRISEEIAVGLAAAHARGLIHRDVKPANIWLELGTDRVKILDFGLACSLDEEGRLTRSGEVMGTPAYMAPEQARGQTSQVGPETDVFAVGAILYQMLTGRQPYQGSLQEPLRQAEEAKVKPPRELNPKTPRRVERICLKAMAAEPSQRYPTAEALANELRRCRDRDRRWVGVGLALVGVLLVSAGIWWVSHGPQRAEKSTPAENPAPLSGNLVVKVTAPGQGFLRIDEPGAVPLPKNEQFRVDAVLNRDAFAYVLVVDKQGQIIPLYPWNDNDAGKIEKDLDDEPLESPQLAARAFGRSISSPRKADSGWPADLPAGLTSVVLLARTTPLRAEVGLKQLLGKLDRRAGRTPTELVYDGFDEDKPLGVINRSQSRGKTKWVSRQVNDPLRQVLQELREQHFQVVRVVRFVCQGE
jgi:hypothetical protein